MSEMDGQEKRLLLISNSTLYGGGYLDHAELLSFHIDGDTDGEDL